MKFEKASTYLILLFLVTSCSSYKFEFIDTNNNIKSKLDDAFLKYLKGDELYISFMNTYQNYPIKVLQNEKEIFDSLITTENKGVASTVKVNNKSDVIVYFKEKEFPKPLVIEKKYLDRYKFIFIYKNKNKVLIEFNNGKVGP